MSAPPEKKGSPALELDWGGRARGNMGPGAAPVEPPSGEGRGAPGDPKYMGMELKLALGSFFETPTLRVRQIREWAEILVGWETRNRYEASDSNGRFLFFIGETGEGLAQALLRNFWPFRRIHLECMTSSGTRVLTVDRPFTFLFTRAHVAAWDGREMGVIQQRFRLFGRRLDILTPAGVLMATVEGPLLRPWTFRVMQRGQEVATIRKKWSGLAQEFFSDADNFGVEFKPGCADPRLRQLVLAATLLVDLTYFEQRDNRGRLLPLE